MDPAWRVKKHYGKGTRRLILGFSRRKSAGKKLGLRAGLRRFGRELPYRGPLALVVLATVSVVGVSTLFPAVVPDSALLLTLLDAPTQVERVEPVDVHVPQSDHVDLRAERSREPVEPEPSRSNRRRRAQPSPQIDSLAGIVPAETHREVASRPRRVSPIPAPARPEGSRPVLPAVAAEGPGRAGPIGRPRRGSNRMGPPKLAMASLEGTLPFESDSEFRPGGRRIAVPAPQVAAKTATRSSPALRGVPLGSLASCLSERREEALKQEVVARVPTPTTCESASGTYRFVETKNLNAFLMWIDRAENREEADRCTELSLAIDCLSSGAIEKEAEES